MVSFRELWDSVVNALKAEAATLGVDTSRIVKGTPFIQMKILPPFIYVYCLPGDDSETNNTNATGGYADISIFCAALPAPTPEESLITAVELQGKIIKTLAPLGHLFQFQESGLEVEPNSQQTITVTLYKGRYAYA